MINYSIYDDGNGGEIYIKESSIEYSKALYVAVYLRMFGGNVEGVTNRDNKTKEERLDWWGNDIKGDGKSWVNSKSEKLLKSFTITQSNILLLEDAIKKDLDDLKKYGEIKVEIIHSKINQISIKINIIQGKNNQIQMVWENTLKEIIEVKYI
jgi:hypothetical protein